MAFDIFQVELDLFVEGYVGAAADLPDAGQAGRDAESAAVGQRVLRDLRDPGWARTDQRHVAFEHAQQLGQFIAIKPVIADLTIKSLAARGMKAWIAGSIHAQSGPGAAALEGNYRTR